MVFGLLKRLLKLHEFSVTWRQHYWLPKTDHSASKPTPEGNGK